MSTIPEKLAIVGLTLGELEKTTCFDFARGGRSFAATTRRRVVDVVVVEDRIVSVLIHSTTSAPEAGYSESYALDTYEATQSGRKSHGGHGPSGFWHQQDMQKPHAKIIGIIEYHPGRYRGEVGAVDDEFFGLRPYVSKVHEVLDGAG